MKLGMVGLGRMGMNMARRLLQGGHQIVAFNRSPEKTEEIMKEGAEGSFSLQELVDKLESPRIVWLMLPAGKLVDDHVDKLKKLLAPGDIIVEGGNSNYHDDIRRSADLLDGGVHYVDAGVSGGIWGLKVGYCTMVGGERNIFEFLEPVFKTLAPPDGHLYCGPAGAGHFVKMIHNGIEYGMMQAYGEGFALLEASPFADSLDFGEVARLWNQGSVIRSWLLELLEDAFAKDPKLTEIMGYVDDSGEGRWTVEQAIDSRVAAPVITMALFQRFQSRNENLFENRVLAALRREFGGHEVKKSS
ncbi:MAG: decarboxylating 6-phosphogluconate dehydrogenase [Thermodesulfobacteriota bacterium]|nr:decarboxylating 6-phosphogluconate dehydrogenase [Thermodesulfobacteriota bacterium]